MIMPNSHSLAAATIIYELTNLFANKNFKLDLGMLDKKNFYINGKWTTPIRAKKL